MEQQLLRCLELQEEVKTLEATLLHNPPLDSLNSLVPKWVQEATKGLQERAVELERKMDLGLVKEDELLTDPLTLRLLRACPEVIHLIQSFDLAEAIEELDGLMAFKNNSRTMANQSR